MANVSRVNGFRPLRYLSGAPYNGAFSKYTVAAADATAMMVGDLVKLAATGDSSGYRSVTRAAATNPVIGAVVGFEVDPTALNVPLHRAASTLRTVYVADDPSILFVAQEDGDTTPVAMTNAGLNVDIIVAAGNTVTGSSGMQIDSSSVTTTNTAALKLIEPLMVQDNELVAAGQANTRWVVKINNHQLLSATGAEGV